MLAFAAWIIVTLNLKLSTHTEYICWAQSMDPDNPQIALLKAWSGLCIHCGRRLMWRGISQMQDSEVRDRQDIQGQERGRCLPWLTKRPSKTTSSAPL